MDIDISLIFGDAARWIMPVLALFVAAFCVPSLLKGNKKIGVTGYLVNEANGDRPPLPVTLFGRTGGPVVATPIGLPPPFLGFPL